MQASNNGMSGMNAASLQDMQQRILQQQQFRGQAQPVMGGATPNFGANVGPQQVAMLQRGANMNSNTAMSMMQQQQQQQQQAPQQHPGSNAMMAGNGGAPAANNTMFNGFPSAGMAGNVGGASPMDASSGSSARLMALAGMGGFGNKLTDPSSSTMQNMQVLLQHQQKVQQPQTMGVSMPQTPGAYTGQQHPTIPNVAAVARRMSEAGNAQNAQQLLFQRQLALSNQAPHGVAANNGGVPMQQHHVVSQGGVMPGALANAPGLQQPGPSNNMLQAHQQQLLQQMQQQQQAGGNVPVANMVHQMPQATNTGDMLGMMQQQMPGMQHLGNMTFNAGGATMGNQTMGMNSMDDGLRMHPQGMMRSSSSAMAPHNANAVHSHAMGTATDAQHMRFPQQMQQLVGDNTIQQMGQNTGLGGHHVANQFAVQQKLNTGMGDSSVNSFRSTTSQQVSLPIAGTQQQNPMQQTDQHKNFLDGSFAGGWQSNADLPDRRQVIYRILEVIKQMRPDSDQVSTKLPHMAKSLEEHLYRSAQTKEEYMDFSTLRRRLQAIAHGLEMHRSTSQNSNINGMQGDGDSQRNMSGQGNSHGSSQFQQMQSSSSSPHTNAVSLPMSQHMNASWGNNSSNNSTNPKPTGNFGSVNQLTAQMNQGHMPMGQLGTSSGLLNASSSQATVNNLRQNFNNSVMTNPQMGASSTPGNMFGGAADTFNSNSINQGMQQNHVGMNNFSQMGGMSQQPIQQQSMGQTQQVMSNNMFQSSNDDFLGQQQRQSFSSSQGIDTSGRITSDSSQQMLNSSQGGMGDFFSVSNLDPNDPNAMQKQKVILQQQQRLLLLRHASKCTAGPSCQTRFCSQMVTLWKHMKSCRNKNCKTPHCVSSRCVLNHYRICKGQGKTATCEVCGPVMLKIKQKERDDGIAGDPLTRDQDMQMQPLSMQSFNSIQSVPTPPPPHQQPLIQPQQQLMPSAQLMQGSHDQSISQQQQQQQQQQSNTEDSQLKQVQAQQMKLKAALGSLKQLQKKQEDLLKQQRILEMQAQQLQDPSPAQSQLLEQQRTLLQNLQEKCQQQQLHLQQEVQNLVNQGGAGGGMPGAGQQQTPSMMQSSFMQQGLSQHNQLQQTQQQMPFQQQQSMGHHPDLHSENPQSHQSLQDDSTLFPPDMLGSQSLQRDSPSPLVDSTVSSEQVATKSAIAKRKSPATVRVIGGKGRRGGKGKTLDLGASSRKLGNPDGKRKRSSAVEADLEPLAVKLDNQEADDSANQGDDENNRSYSATPLEDRSSSLVASMRKDDIAKHIESLSKRIRLSSHELTEKCSPVLQTLIEDPFGWVFLDAVDPVALGLPDYFEVVKTPMNLHLVKENLEKEKYSDLETFTKDVRLVFENAILYNGDKSEVGELAQSMLNKFDDSLKAMCQDVESPHLNVEDQGEKCFLCGSRSRKFIPTVLYCQGKCQTQIIRRKETYYSDPRKLKQWCKTCYDLMNEHETVFLDEGSETRKGDLQAFVNDELSDELWVRCNQCRSRVHQICSLFNGRSASPMDGHCCPSCYLAASERLYKGLNAYKGAEQLPHNKLSLALEDGVKRSLAAAYMDKSNEEGIPVEHVKKAEPVTVRVLSDVKTNIAVGEEMRERYKSKGYPQAFPVRMKCIALFQKIHGIDTLLFLLYVQEYGDGCACPNRRRVYISSMDSVNYFEPKCYRTLTFQTMILEYLRFVKHRGFHTAHISSIPPVQGDDFLFHRRPDNQRIPNEEMLRSWYHCMLRRARNEGIALRTSTLYAEYFTADSVDSVEWDTSEPTCLPYFDGDYITGELENIIKCEPTFNDVSGIDPVMEHLGKKLYFLKDNFIVVHLLNRRSADAVKRGEGITHWEEHSEEVAMCKRARNGKDPCGVYSRDDISNGTTKGVIGSLSTVKREEASSVDGNLQWNPTLIGDTSDSDAEMLSDIFQSRESFLRFCRSSRCQFDELRRAKHSTMIILDWLHSCGSKSFGRNVRGAKGSS